MIEADPVLSVLARARAAVVLALSEPDLEAFLCAALLWKDRPAWATAGVASLLAAPAPPLSRPAGVAVVGLRLALGVEPPDRAALEAALRRELSREPLPPAPRAHDDERILLGVAAGVSAFPGLGDALIAACQSAAGRSLRWDVVRLWSARIATGGMTAEVASSMVRLVAERAGKSTAFRDAVALLWLAGELLDSAWGLDDAQRSGVGEALRGLQRAVILEAPETLDALDAAMLLRGLGAVAVASSGREPAVAPIAMGTGGAGVVGAADPGRRPPARLSRPAKIFVSYSHEDEVHRRELGKHLTVLQRQGSISVWNDRQILVGVEWKGEIDRNLEEADIILLLVSPDFLASDYCWDIEMKRAMERHDAREAYVVPIFVRACSWRGSPFEKLQGVPDPKVPIAEAVSKDAAWTAVAEALRRLVDPR
ncbi:MAG: toll/interleukin-1 receptor domain-containing protein [Pseudomonadota bacterium]|nr:toll/interleukin-1 receptor domain-containing protein [Pseudomonadota bacterium]